MEKTIPRTFRARTFSRSQGQNRKCPGFHLMSALPLTKQTLRPRRQVCAINGQPFAPIFNCLASGSGSQLLECSDVTDFPTKKRRSVTTSFSACRITATVDASYFCFRSVIVADRCRALRVIW